MRMHDNATVKHYAHAIFYQWPTPLPYYDLFIATLYGTYRRINDGKCKSGATGGKSKASPPACMIL